MCARHSRIIALSLIVALSDVTSKADGENPQYTLFVERPGGDLVEGQAGADYDDGTLGAPDFHVGGKGWTWTIKLKKENSPPDDIGKTFGWKWALGVEGLQITAVTLNGTIACPQSMGGACLGGSSFDQRTELTGLPFGEGPRTDENHGALSEVLLGFEGSFLRGNGIWEIAKIRVTAEFPDEVGQVHTGRVYFEPRIGSLNDPVPQLVYYSGTQILMNQGNPPLTVQGRDVELRAVEAVDEFIRCDVNDDGVVDIADAIWLLMELFRAGARTKCPIARDCNGDGEANISDPIYGLLHLFLSAPQPPPPFPECGEMKGMLEDDCPGGATRCP